MLKKFSNAVPQKLKHHVERVIFFHILYMEKMFNNRKIKNHYFLNDIFW